MKSFSTEFYTDFYHECGLEIREVYENPIKIHHSKPEPPKPKVTKKTLRRK